MNHIFPYFLVMVLFMAILARITIWSRKDSWVRHGIMAAFLMFAPIAMALAVDTLGWHRPISMAWRINGDFSILAVKMVRYEGIYLYLDVPGEPRSVVLPWDADKAKEMQDTLDDPEGGGLRFKYEWSWEKRDPPLVYPAPPPPLPLPKGDEPEPPTRYEREA